MEYQPFKNANITKAIITVSGVTGNNKVYDGLVDASVTGTLQYNGFVHGESFIPSVLWSFDDASAGINKPIHGTFETLENYSIEQPSLSANITKLSIYVSGFTIAGLIADDKVYDGTTNATVTGTLVYSGFITNDYFNPSVTWSFADASVGNHKVNGTFELLDNYSIEQPNLYANITKASVSVSGVTGSNKVYDGLVNASVTGTFTYNGFIYGESFTPSVTWSFLDASVGNDKQINGVFESLENYTIENPIISANITKAPLTITANDKLILYGSSVESLISMASYDISAFKNNETVSNLTGSISYVTTYTSYKTANSSSTIRPLGFSSNNYQITYVSGSVTVFEEAIAGTISGNVNIMSGNNTTLTLMGYTGVIQWQMSLDNNSWTNIGQSSNAYVTNNLTENTYYRARVSTISTNVTVFSDSVYVILKKTATEIKTLPYIEQLEYNGRPLVKENVNDIQFIACVPALQSGTINNTSYSYEADITLVSEDNHLKIFVEDQDIKIGPYVLKSSRPEVYLKSGNTYTKVTGGQITINGVSFNIESGSIELILATSAGAHGDPYITTFNGFQYKLPNIVRTYRLLEYNDIVVNATVSELTNQEKQDMKTVGLQEGIKEMINGFFFESFYIHTEHGHIVFDRQLNITEQKGEFTFTKGKGNLRCPIQGTSTYTSIIIQLHGVKISLRKYKNPQVLNGIDISVSRVEKAKGLLNSFCNPKHYTIKKMNNIKPLHVVDDKVYSKKVKEIWVKRSSH